MADESIDTLQDRDGGGTRRVQPMFFYLCGQGGRHRPAPQDRRGGRGSRFDLYRGQQIELVLREAWP